MAGIAVLGFSIFPLKPSPFPAQNDGCKLKKQPGLRVPRLLFKQPESASTSIKVTRVVFFLVWSGKSADGGAVCFVCVRTGCLKSETYPRRGTASLIHLLTHTHCPLQLFPSFSLDHM